MFINKASYLAQPKPHLDGLKGLETAMQFALCCVPGTPEFSPGHTAKASGASTRRFTAGCVSPTNLYGKPTGSSKRSSHLAAGHSPKKSHRCLSWMWCGNQQDFTAAASPGTQIPRRETRVHHIVHILPQNPQQPPSTQIPPRLYSASAAMNQRSGRGRAKKTDETTNCELCAACRSVSTQWALQGA